MRRTIAIAVAVAALAASRPAAAWEAETTHAGLTERAALASRLHTRLREQFGIAYGLLGALIVPPADARELHGLLRRYNPSHGYVPDTRGRLSALGWLVAGSVIADQPAAHWGNHFYDPLTGKGLDDRTLRSLRARLEAGMGVRRSRQLIARRGMPAPAWVIDKTNPMNLDGFVEQYVRAVGARTPAERARHLAGALVAAGALLHVLEDMGSPSHVRDDLAAHLENLDPDGAELGSRYERVAALAYGRLGVPGPRTLYQAASFTDFYLALAQRTSRRWFSAGTLPASFTVPRRYTSAELHALLRRALRRAEPAPAGHLDLIAAARLGGQELDDAAGTCLARYQVISSRLHFSLDDECMAEQVAAVLPEVAGYAGGMLDWLFRGQLTLTGGTELSVTASVDVGAGSLELYAENAAGVRTAIGKIPVQGAAAGQVIGGAPLTSPAADATRFAAVFRGVDGKGQPLVAAGLLAPSAP